MARDKVKKVGTHRTRIPLGIQDGTDLITTILEAVDVTLIAPIELRITVIETAIERILAALALAGQVQSVDVELPRRRSGHVDVEARFAQSQVGAPVMVGQGSPRDDLEGIVLFAGEVRDAHTLRLTWQAATIPPRKVRINYIIGTTEE